MLRIIGESPLQMGEDGIPHVRIATYFPDHRVLVTLPGIHATQRTAMTDDMDGKLKAEGKATLTEEQIGQVWTRGVDLIIADDGVLLIRPDPDQMDLAFVADEHLQEILPKQRIQFLHVMHDCVRKSIQRRGDMWRIEAPPKSVEEIKKVIAASRAGIGNLPIYYYSPVSGIRWLTVESFADLGRLETEALRAHLAEIGKYCNMRNARMRPEVAFFMAPEKFKPQEFSTIDFAALSPADLKEAHSQLLRLFILAVPPQYHADDPADPQWRNQMYCDIADRHDDLLDLGLHFGLSAEFFMQIEWLPGGRLENGRFTFDSAWFDRGEGSVPIHHENTVRGLLFNFIEEYSDIDYINIGCVVDSLCPRPPHSGRREVFVVQYKRLSASKEATQIIRMQKWGVREHLNDNEDLLRAMFETEEYTDYIMDRRLACLQLGMNIPKRLSVHKLTEIYTGTQQRYVGTKIWSTYFRRDYVAGLASDKAPKSRLQSEQFSTLLARHLGKSAVLNLVVGRCVEENHIIFDDGDEIVLLDEQSMPQEIMIADPTGAFTDFRTPLTEMVCQYGDSIRKKFAPLPFARKLYDEFMMSFRTTYEQVLKECWGRQKSLLGLFQHRRPDSAGNFAYRWIQCLNRLLTTDSSQVFQNLENHLKG